MLLELLNPPVLLEAQTAYVKLVLTGHSFHNLVVPNVQVGQNVTLDSRNLRRQQPLLTVNALKLIRVRVSYARLRIADLPDNALMEFASRVIGLKMDVCVVQTDSATHLASACVESAWKQIHCQ